MDETIAAISTPFGQGAVALIRISGPDAKTIVGKVFGGELTARKAVFGELVDQEKAVVDQGLVTLFEEPASYTGEDVVEIGCHGGVLVTQRVLESVLAAGARMAEPGEFTQRAFLHGKMDLTQAEAVMDLIQARTSLALRAANAQLEGKIGTQMMQLREDLLGVLAHVEAYIDFPDEDIDPETTEQLTGRLAVARETVKSLLATAEQGRILREGVATVICGAPNVGKSSLLNVLLGFERAIVSEIAGTTRDTLEEVISLKGIPLRLIDTAGVRDSDDVIEKEGIARTEKQLEQAQLVLEIVDGSRPDEGAIGDRSASSHVLVINKADLGVVDTWSGKGGIEVSCLEQTGIDALAEEIYARLTKGNVEWGANIAAINARHRDCLTRAEKYLAKALEAMAKGESAEFVALEVREAMDAIGEVVGKADVEELLGEIFGAFCIGK